MSKHERQINYEESLPKPYLEQGGICYWAEQIRPVDQSDIKQLKTPTTSIVHIARHLQALSLEARSKMIGQTINEENGQVVIDDTFLDRQLETAGSKFHPAITDPEILAAFCQEKIQDIVKAGGSPIWLKNKTAPELSVDFQIPITDTDKQRFDIPANEGFGTSSLIKITPEIADQVVPEQRGFGQAVDNLTVNIVRGIKIPQTDSLIITLKRPDIDQPSVLHTAYTGITTPPLPRLDNQSPEEYQYNKDWWNQYAFIK